MINITRSIESYDSVFGIKQSVTLTGSNKPFDNELSTSESVRILKELLLEYDVSVGTPYTHSNENVILDFFGFIIDLIGKIIKGIRNFFARIFGFKTDNDKINDIKRELANKKSQNRANMIRRIKESLYRNFGKIYTRSTSDKPIFPNLSKFNISIIGRRINGLLDECDDVFKFLSTAGWGYKVPEIDVYKFLPLSELYKVMEQFEIDGKKFTPHISGMFLNACDFDKFGMYEYFYDDRADDIIKYYVNDFDNVKNKITNWSNDLSKHLKYWQSTLSDIKTKINRNSSIIDKGQNDKQIATVQKWTSELVHIINLLIGSQVSFVSLLVHVNLDIGFFSSSAKSKDNIEEKIAGSYISYHQNRTV